MAAPIAAGVLIGCAVYYGGRVLPRIAQRATAAAAYGRVSQPYQRFEYGFQKTMTEREAYLTLGFSEAQASALVSRPSEDEVKQRYRALMKEMHSDVCGTPYVAAKINEAKDQLVK